MAHFRSEQAEYKNISSLFKAIDYLESSRANFPPRIQINGMSVFKAPLPEAVFKCNECDKVFSRKFGLIYHIREKHQITKKYKCEKCGLEYSRFDSLRRHQNVTDSSYGGVCRTKKGRISYKEHMDLRAVKSTDFHGRDEHRKIPESKEEELKQNSVLQSIPEYDLENDKMEDVQRAETFESTENMREEEALKEKSWMTRELQEKMHILEEKQKIAALSNLSPNRLFPKRFSM
jgi:uncharacterized Zn-finger protein